ncbi:Hypothetical protein CAP_4153 [Chondromyces apiculatus DSM 436]|uniref:Uncharacterized protein n=1 Tax=Chondromyces apiculatus DSM 436 TaxID=1192034 RepID=A0A017TH81_9BACT|nr:Hypothetical protein CAP_4153 [Chondromyces apiculatus DSM 436]
MAARHRAVVDPDVVFLRSAERQAALRRHGVSRHAARSKDGDLQRPLRIVPGVHPGTPTIQGEVRASRARPWTAGSVAPRRLQVDRCGIVMASEAPRAPRTHPPTTSASELP